MEGPILSHKTTSEEMFHRQAGGWAEPQPPATSPTVPKTQMLPKTKTNHTTQFSYKLYETHFVI